jgi:exodeoxyribonuclease V alpha subunit
MRGGIDRRWPPAWGAALAGPEVDEAALYLALEAASWPRDLAPAARRAFALVVLASCEARTEGATRLPLGAELGDRLDRLGARAEDRQAALALALTLGEQPALAALVGRPGDHRPLLVDGSWLYQERDLRLELRLAGALATRLVRPPTPVPGGTSAAGAARPWTPAQRAAIEAACARALTVVTGGPGSGKTALIGGIVRAWRVLGMTPESIAVAAPTGKAANRVAEGLAADGISDLLPGTLHRLLGFSAHRSLHGSRFRRHENNPLPHAGVIVDEASMLDLALVDQLVRALRPEARLVLIGDADQLPAIQAGSVFRDLGTAALRLPESHRMSPDDPAGAAILAAARAIAAGEAPAGNAAVGLGGLEALAFSGYELVEPDPRDASGRRLVAAFCAHWFGRHLAPALAAFDPRAPLGLEGQRLDSRGEAIASGLLDRHRRARLLTVTRVGDAGSDRINAALARRAADELRIAIDGDALAPGTPVMMVENDYDRNLMNGDQGVALDVAGGSGGRTGVVAFSRDGALALFPTATLRGAIAVSYATTVHKTQGSELESAALILPGADLPLLSRELVYTAVTRARESMVVVGRRALLAAAAGRPLGRSSGLAERLAARGAFAAPATRTIDDR